MPQMANVTVKNAANADTIFVAAVPSAGDKTPARWNINAASTIAGFRPTVTVGTRDNGQKNGRLVESNALFPVTATPSGGVEMQVAGVVFKGSASLPRNVDSTKVLDAWVLYSNFMTSALMRAVADEGYAPT